MAYADLNTLHNPSTGVAPPASWGDQVRDNFEFFNSALNLGQWTNFSPSVLQSISVSRTVVYARYVKHGRLVLGQCALTITSNGTASQAVIVTMPVTAAVGLNTPCGVGYHYNGGANIPLITLLANTTQFGFIAGSFPVGNFYGTTANIPIPVVGGATTSTPSQLANGHSLVFTFAYESAS